VPPHFEKGSATHALNSTVVESGRVTELFVAASYEPVTQARKSDISSIQTGISCE